MSASQPPLPSQPAKPQVKALNCPQCGAAITLRSFQQAVTVVCENCHSILDAKDPTLKILQQFQAITGELKPLSSRSARAETRGTDYEVIGFQRRSIESDGVRYDWHEYLLFNPYKGFRYLSEYQGHWNDISVCKNRPPFAAPSSPPPTISAKIFATFRPRTPPPDTSSGNFPGRCA
jgi:hypothetical protein